MSAHLLRQLEAAHAAVRALVTSGHVVLSVAVSGVSTKPVIEVAHTPACAELRGISSVEVATDNVISQFMVALVSECRVQWRVN